ncbi:Haloalkane dehalogenase 2 [Flavobacterium sp. PL0002]|nr:Haloalkane dehalogenase 2 [Flavobacterium sp. PL002]
MVVQDWGGPTALHLAVNQPDCILGIVISSTWAWKANSESEKFSNFFKIEEGQRLIYEENYFVRTLLLKSMNKKWGNNKAIIVAYEMAFRTPESRKGTLVFPQQITLSESWFQEIEEKLQLLADKPVELILGEKNRTLGNPESIAKWRSFYPNANVQLFPDADHFTQEESPESFVFALRRILKENKENKNSI